MGHAFHVLRPVPVPTPGRGPSRWSAWGNNVQFCRAVGWPAEPSPTCSSGGVALRVAYPGHPRDGCGVRSLCTLTAQRKLASGRDTPA